MSKPRILTQCCKQLFLACDVMHGTLCEPARKRCRMQVELRCTLGLWSIFHEWSWKSLDHCSATTVAFQQVLLRSSEIWETCAEFHRVSPAVISFSPSHECTTVDMTNTARDQLYFGEMDIQPSVGAAELCLTAQSTGHRRCPLVTLSQ